MDQPIELLSSDGEQNEPQKVPAKAHLNPLGSSGPLCPNIYGKERCRCKKDNPNCLTGIIPGPTGFRKKGLWQRDTKALLGTGDAPCGDEREDGTPSGLNNLGNTCYVNGALQCLFMTPAFRLGLYSVEEEVARDEVIGHIRSLFAAMQMSARASADPSAFASSLNLDNSIQQDGQEFFKLLLSHLETKLKKASSEDLRTLVPRLFRGSYVFETKCMACQKLSESSKRETGFYELDVQVKGYAALEDSLRAMQNPELLEGSNQFFCGHCNAKVDASRQLSLKSLPPHLCLSLQRFVFDMKKFTKVKASDKMSFPLTLDAAELVSPQGSVAGECPQQTYELAAILIHKGPSAFHGHYVAHIKEEGSEKWWRCDDEAVTLLPEGPMQCPADLGVAAEKKVVTQQPKQKRGRPATKEGGLDNLSKTAQEAEAADPGRIVASNAYMLLYRPPVPPEARLAVELPEALAAEVTAANEAFTAQRRAHQERQQAMLEGIRSRQQRVRDILEAAPMRTARQEHRYVSAAWLRKWADSVDQLPIDSADILCSHGRLHPEKIKDAKKVSLGAWEGIWADCGGKAPPLGEQDICRECLGARMEQAQSQEALLEKRVAALAMLEAEEASGRVHPFGGFFVSKPWLTGWKKRSSQTMSLTSPTEGITCPHGRLLPEMARTKAKRAAVPGAVWEYFEDLWTRTQQEHRASIKRKAQVAADEAAAKRLQREGDREEVVLLDDGWQQPPKELLEPKQQPVTNGAGSPASSAASDEWKVVGEQEEEEQVVSISSFPVGTAECRECIDNLLRGAAEGEDLKEQLQHQKLTFHMLHQATASYLDPGGRFCLLPRAWMKQWRAHLSSGHRRDANAGPPRPLDQALDDLLCTCHRATAPRLAFPPPPVSKKRGKWVADQDSVFEVVPAAEAEQLLDFYASRSSDEIALPYAQESRHPRMLLASLEIAEQAALSVPAHSCGKGPAGQEPANTTPTDADVEMSSGNGDDSEMEEAANGLSLKSGGRRLEEETGLLACVPEVCALAVEERHARSLAVALDYESAEIVVELVKRDNLQDAPSERKSRRSRKGRAVLRVGASTSLQQLRYSIAQELGVHPLNALIHTRRADGSWHLLQGDDATLKGLEILPETELRVVSSEEHDDSDLASFVEDSSKPSGGAQERGFAGTALTGHSA